MLDWPNKRKIRKFASGPPSATGTGTVGGGISGGALGGSGGGEAGGEEGAGMPPACIGVATGVPLPAGGPSPFGGVGAIGAGALGSFAGFSVLEVVGADAGELGRALALS